MKNSEIKIICRKEKDLNKVIRPVVIFQPQEKDIYLDCLSFEGHCQMSYSYYRFKTKPATLDYCKNLLLSAGYILEELKVKKRLTKQ